MGCQTSGCTGSARTRTSFYAGRSGVLTETWQTPTAKTVKDMICLFFVYLALPLGRVFTVSGRGTGDGGAKVREKEMMMEEVDGRARGVGVSAQALAH